MVETLSKKDRREDGSARAVRDDQTSPVGEQRWHGTFGAESPACNTPRDLRSSAGPLLVKRKRGRKPYSKKKMRRNPQPCSTPLSGRRASLPACPRGAWA